MDLTVKDSFVIPGRGLIFTFSLKENNIEYTDLPGIGKEIYINKKSYFIRGYEGAMILTDPPKQSDNMAVLVKEVLCECNE